MGRWFRLSKQHPDITDDNEVVNVLELGGPQGNQVVQGDHFYQAGKVDAHALATFIKTESALEHTEAEWLWLENIKTRLDDGYVHGQYMNFRLGKLVYVGKWNPALERFVND
jgi:hypothetical protein